MQLEKLKTVDAETLLSTPLKKTMFIVKGLIPQGVSILCGSSKIGKSWLMLWLGLQVAQGLSVWDIPTEKGDVLYLCLEDTLTRVQSRLYHLTETAPSNLRFAVMSSQIGCGLETEIKNYITEFPQTKLIIIDTLQKVRNGKSGTGKNGMYGDDYDDISALKRIADEYNISVLLVHHLRKLKDSEDPFNQISGSTGITGAVDTAFLLKRDTATSDTATLIAKGRDIEMQQLKLRFVDRVWELIERKDQEELQKEEIPGFLFRLVEFAKGKSEWCGSATELIEEMQEAEITPASVTRLISHFYYEILEPNEIEYRTKRTGSKRIIKLKHRDNYDGCDKENSISVHPSFPSSTVTEERSD